MSAAVLRTRRQLREALHASRTKEGELDTALREATVKKGENTRLRADLAAAESALHSIGYERSIERRLAVDLGLLAPHEEWQPKQGLTPTLTAVEHEKIITAISGEVQASTRRETLQAVIDALQLKGDYGRAATPDIFWAEIQVALDVREERKRTEDRARVEQKVSRLRAPAPRPLVGVDAASGVSVFASILDDGRVQVDHIAEPGGSYGAATTLAKPKTTKKSKGDKK